MKPNRMNDKIARGEPALGCSVMFPSPQIVEMLGCAGFDWVLIDCEHGSISANDVELMAMACDAAGITPIARPKTKSPSDIQAVMDRGVMGVQVPHINTGDDARGGRRRQVRCGLRARVGRRYASRRLGHGRTHGGFRTGRQRPIARLRATRARGGACQHRRYPGGRGH
jgi:hypothetical protein